jgi:hypothetical protein
MSIGNSAFRECIGLKSITIGNSVTNIGYSAFLKCTGLASAYLPSSVQTIGSYPFDSCSSSLVIYTDLLETDPVPTGWDSKWNKTNSSTTLTVVYGYTRTAYEQLVSAGAQSLLPTELSNLNNLVLTNDLLLVKRKFN